MVLAGTIIMACSGELGPQPRTACGGVQWAPAKTAMLLSCTGIRCESWEKCASGAQCIQDAELQNRPKGMLLNDRRQIVRTWFLS